MRADTKAASILSFTIVVIGGVLYYSYRDQKEKPVSLAGEVKSVATDSRQAATPASSNRPETKDKSRQKKSTQLAESKRDPSNGSAGTQKKPGRARRGSQGAAQLSQGGKEVRPASPFKKKPGARTAMKNPKSTRSDTAKGRGANPQQLPPKGPVVANSSDKQSKVIEPRQISSDGSLIKDLNAKKRTTKNSNGKQSGFASNTATGARIDGTGQPRKSAESKLSLTAKAKRAHTPGSSKFREASVDIHVVKSGDSFAKMAVMYYGSEKLVQKLIEANPHIKAPNLLQIGDEIRIPEEALLAAGLKALTRKPKTQGAELRKPGQSTPTSRANVYVVKTGDSFYAIAHDQLGDANRWKELLQLNSKLVKNQPKLLKPGMTLLLPEIK